MRSNFPSRALVLLLTCLVTACAAAPSGDARDQDGERVRVTLRDYTAGRSFELVSKAHTDRLAYYSQVRESASRKIQENEVMEALVDQLDSDGFDDYARQGRAPEKGGGVVRRSLEIDSGSGVKNWVVGQGASRDEQLVFQECMTTFLALYNISAAYQTIENPDGARFFDRERTRVQAGAKRNR